MLATDIIEEITAHCQRVIERALPADVLGKLIVLPMLPSEDCWGLASGSGHIAARAHRGAATDRAIAMDVRAIVDFYGSLPEARAAALAIGCHEVSHLLVAKPDPETTTAEATAIWAEILTSPSIGGAGWHCPRWAGSFFVAVDRLRGVLPLGEHRRLVRHSWSGLRRYGFRPLEILDVLAGLSLPESIGAAFASDTAASLALMGACDDESARQAWIDRSTRKTLASVASAA